MTTTLDRAEINRRNAQKSTGPRTAEGKERSRFNAVKHGCRARLPILPGEDPDAYRLRLDAWVGKFAPRDAVEHYLVERAVHVSWQLDRADRAELARLAEEAESETARLAEDVATLGAELFRVPAGPIGGGVDPVGESESTLLSWPFDPEHPRHPARLVAVLEATAAGCDWLLGKWAALGKILDEGRRWQAADRLRAIRMLGQQPLDVVADRQLLTIYLACHVMDPDGPDVFAEPLGDLCRPETAASRERLSARFDAARGERAPRDVPEARAALRAIVTAAVARTEALQEVRAAAEADEVADISARLSYSAKESVEWLRKHQVTCSRALFRTFDELRKIRRDFGDDRPADEPAPGPRIDEAMASPPFEAVATPVVPPSGACPVAEPDDLRTPVAGPVALEPIDDLEVRAVTNEPSAPSVVLDAGRTNEANRPAEVAATAMPSLLAAVPTVLAMLGPDSLEAIGSGVGTDPSLQMHRDAERSERRDPPQGLGAAHDWTKVSGRQAADEDRWRDPAPSGTGRRGWWSMDRRALRPPILLKEAGCSPSTEAPASAVSGRSQSASLSLSSFRLTYTLSRDEASIRGDDLAMTAGAP